MQAYQTPDFRRVLSTIRYRFKLVRYIVLLAFGILIFRLIQLQIFDGEIYYQKALSNISGEGYISPYRGKILDKNKKVLVTNRPVFDVYVNRKQFTTSVQNEFVKRLGLNPKEIKTIKKRLETKKKHGSNDVLILEEQDRERIVMIHQFQEHFQGTRVDVHSTRYYPYEEVAGHLLGYMSHLTSKELSSFIPQGYAMTELIGRAGLERQWERELHGTRGVDHFVKDARGNRIEDTERLSDFVQENYQKPTHGSNLILSLDLDLQKIAEDAVKKYPAAAVAVVDVNTGYLLSLVSHPSLNPNVMTGHLTHDAAQTMISDPREPFVDKTLQQHYPPGSVFKFIPMIAALQQNVISENTTMYCNGSYERGGRIFSCSHQTVHGHVNIREGLQQSCNIFVWKLTEKIDVDTIAATAREFGFGHRTGLNLNGDSAGLIPTRAWYKKHGLPFHIGHAFNTSVGQGDVQVTVLQMAMAYAAIANGGKLYQPQVVLSLETQNGKLIKTYVPILKRQIDVTPQILNIIRDGMYRAVNTPLGTAYRARSSKIRFSGKTGTAQTTSHQPVFVVDDAMIWDPSKSHAWFICYAPSDQPKIVVAVLVEHGGFGGGVAAPIAKAIFEQYALQAR